MGHRRPGPGPLLTRVGGGPGVHPGGPGGHGAQAGHRRALRRGHGPLRRLGGRHHDAHHRGAQLPAPSPFDNPCDDDSGQQHVRPPGGAEHDRLVRHGPTGPGHDQAAQGVGIRLCGGGPGGLAHAHHPQALRAQHAGHPDPQRLHRYPGVHLHRGGAELPRHRPDRAGHQPGRAHLPGAGDHGLLSVPALFPQRGYRL